MRSSASSAAAGCRGCSSPRTSASFERYFAAPYWNRGGFFADPRHAAGLHKRLGELYEAKADHQRAVQHYMKFVELWKDSDADLRPRVDEVRRRIARLSDLENR